MYGPPTVPATGGGWFAIPVAGIAGLYFGSWIIFLVSLLLIGLILFSMYRLRQGEKRIPRR
jgi:uncharacterized membrane protein